MWQTQGNASPGPIECHRHVTCALDRGGMTQVATLYLGIITIVAVLLAILANYAPGV